MDGIFSTYAFTFQVSKPCRWSIIGHWLYCFGIQADTVILFLGHGIRSPSQTKGVGQTKESQGSSAAFQTFAVVEYIHTHLLETDFTLRF